MAVMLMTMGFWALKSPSPAIAETQADPAPIANLTALETTLYWTGLTAFRHRWDAKQGLGPVFTQFQCNECHVNPMDGGGGDLTKRITFFGKLDGSGNFDPLANEGGILLQNNTVARFKPTCHLPGEVIPADATIVQKRLAPMLFGMGLIEAIPEADIVAQGQAVKGFGVTGFPNMVPDENGVFHVGRYGYKAQNATLLQQSGFAFVHEIGITSPIFPIEDPPQGGPIPPECATAAEPNDDGTQLVTMYHFLTYVAPLPPQTPDPNGQSLFNSIGCALCHLPTYTTAARVSVIKTWQPTKTFLLSKAMSNQPVNLYSDLLLHDMGTGAGSLQDQIPMFQASGQQFRTTPLWGLSQRTVYLHDGRTSDINRAIQWHSNGTGEAAIVLSNFNALSASDQADVIAFIKSL